MALPPTTEAAATSSTSSASTLVSPSYRWSRPKWLVGAMVIFLCVLSLRTPVQEYAHSNVQQRDVSLLHREVNGTSTSTHYDRHSSNFSKIASATASAIPLIANSITLSTDSEIDRSFNPENIPLFMREYFKWHNKQLELLHEGKLAWIDGEDNGNEHSSSTPRTAARFLIIRCTHLDRCGGTSDRLRSFPLFVLLAALSKRILLMRWGRPFALEDFMQPAGVWNWTVPVPLMKLLRQEQANLKQSRRHHNQGILRRAVYFDGNHYEKLQQKSLDHQTWVVEGNDFSGGQDHYQRLVNLELIRVADYKKDVALGKTNQTTNTLQSTAFQKSAVAYPWTELRRGDGSYTSFYHDLFHATFVPAQGVQRLLRKYFEHLPRHQYVVAHYRATYPGEPYRENGDLKALQKIIFHAVDCAHTIAPNLAIYVASDTALALEAVSHVYRNRTYSHVDVDTNGNATAKNLSLTRSLDLDVYRSTKVADVPVWTSMDVSQVASNSMASPEANHRVLPPVEDPPHLNFAKMEDPSGFYSIFVDIFLMSQAFCVTYGGGAGAFGIFGSLISKNPLCRIPHTRRGGALEECRRYTPPGS